MKVHDRGVWVQENRFKNVFDVLAIQMKVKKLKMLQFLALAYHVGKLFDRKLKLDPAIDICFDMNFFQRVILDDFLHFFIMINGRC